MPKCGQDDCYFFFVQCSFAEVDFMKENGSLLFIAMMFKFWSKTIFHIFEKCYDQCFLNFGVRIAQKELAFSSFSSREKNKCQIRTVPVHVVKFSAKYETI